MNVSYYRDMEQHGESLVTFGVSNDILRQWDDLETDGLQLGRVIADFGTSLKVALPGIQTAELSGKLAHYTASELQPKVGDWVAVQVFDTQRAVIESVVPRRSEIARKAAGNKTVKQILAANVDLAFVLLALDNDFSVERLKRFLYQLSVNAVTPVIVLNKSDKTDALSGYTEQLQDFGLPIIVTNALTGAGIDDMLAHIQPGMTAILLGSSGVGKSTLTNRLLGRQAQATQPIRESDATGRHTTVHRELFVLPNGGLLIDTPGIRELQLWGTEDDLDDSYDDVVQLISQCRYNTCKHGSEPGCAIQAALHAGTLSVTRYNSYRRMKVELASLKAKNGELAQRHNKKSSKMLRRQSREILEESD